LKPGEVAKANQNEDDEYYDEEKPEEEN